MAPRKKKEYEVKGVPSTIKATSRCAIKVGDCYYTVEATEERTLPVDDKEVNIHAEWKSIFESVNTIVDTQAEEINALNEK